MTARPQPGTLMWQAPEEMKRDSALASYVAWLAEARRLRFSSYPDLWAWSVTRLEDFWASVWDYFRINAHRPYTQVLSTRAMPGARWFAGAELNYAEHVFRMASPARPAMLFGSETQPLRALSWACLRDQAGRAATALTALGVRRGWEIGRASCRERV